MAKKAKELSALAVSKLKAEGRYAVGGADGLHFRVTGNSKAWVLRIKIGAKRSDIGLGPYPEVSLADARELAREHRRKLRTGIDPLAEKREARAALKVAKAKRRRLRNAPAPMSSPNAPVGRTKSTRSNGARR